MVIHVKNEKIKKLLLICILVPAFVSAQVNTLSIPNISTQAGTQIAMPIEMFNEGSVVGVSFTLTLPNGVTVVTDADNEPIYTFNNNRIKSNNFSLISVQQDDGSWGFRLYTTSATGVIKGDEGEIMSITINIDENISSGDYPLVLTQNKLSVKTEDFNVASIPINDYSSIITITGNILKGDVNYDRKVTIADVTSLVDIILGKDNSIPYKYDHIAADVNNDSNITIADVTALVDIILGIKT